MLVRILKTLRYLGFQRMAGFAVSCGNPYESRLNRKVFGKIIHHRPPQLEVPSSAGRPR